MSVEKILSFLGINCVILVRFFLFYSSCGIIIYVLYNFYIRKLSFQNSLKKSYRIFKLLYGFNYPILELYNINGIKKLIAKTFVPTSHMNLFWTDKREIQLKNAKYELSGKKSGIIELTNLILKKEEIEIIYNIDSKDDIKLIVKQGRGKDLNNNTTNRNVFIINDKEFVCDVDTERITVPKCSGYYIFNDSKLEFKSKVRNGEFFSIKIVGKHFFDYEEQYSIKELIDICSVLCQSILFICCLIISVVFIRLNNKIFVSIICIDIFIIKSISSITRRLFDIFKETKCSKQN